MLTILEAATLSGHVYKKKSDQYLNYTINKIDIIKGIPQPLYAGWGYVPNIISSMKPSGPCFCRLYIKFKDGKATNAVIAIRGTDNFDNSMVDLESWGGVTFGSSQEAAIPKYLVQVVCFFNAARDYVRKHFPSIRKSRIYLTGHSLGGALAQLIPLYGQAYYAIAFNAPGCRSMPNIEDKYTSFIVNVNSRYGIINKIDGPPMGCELIIDVPDEADTAKKLFVKFDAMQYARGQSHLDHVSGLGDSAPYLSNGGLDVLNSLADAATPDFTLLHAVVPQMYVYDLIDDTSDNASAIWAQHSIDKMVAALQLPENRLIAYHPIGVKTVTMTDALDKAWGEHHIGKVQVIESDLAMV